MNDRPLITFALFAYNQERFIREAVEGAFAQTYSPLEIILSDDCSTDRTFEMMREMAAAYRGPHQVTVRRNDVNTGLGRHFSRVCGMCRGDVIVFAAGDDISLPQRCETLFQMWGRSGLKAVSMYSSASPIDASGDPYRTEYNYDKPCHPTSVEEVIELETAHVVGATQAVSRELFRRFGHLSEPDIHDDEVLPFRALLCDGILFCQDRLVKYRHHDSNYWSAAPQVGPVDAAGQMENALRTLLRNYRAKLGIRKQWLTDYVKLPERDARIEQDLQRLVALAEHQLNVVTHGFIEGAIATLVWLLRHGSPRGANIIRYKARLLWDARLQRLRALRERAFHVA